MGGLAAAGLAAAAAASTEAITVNGGVIGDAAGITDASACRQTQGICIAMHTGLLQLWLREDADLAADQDPTQSGTHLDMALPEAEVGQHDDQHDQTRA